MATTGTAAASSPGNSTPLATASTGHVGLNVTDLARSIDFYRAVFGFDLLAENQDAGQRFAFLGRDGLLVLTLCQQAGDRFDTARAGLHHLAFDVPTLADVEAAVARLAQLGVPLIYDEIVPHGPGFDSGGIFFADPDGTRIEVCTLSGVGGRTALEHGAPSCGFF
jgi:catechol 2,3-dioxygenase-like lactoylglutathione lyase family enzyme